MVGRYLLDTNTISDIVRRPDGAAAHRYRSLIDECLTSIIVAGEIRFGVAKAPDSNASKRALLFLDDVRIEEFKAPADRFYGSVRADLERRGTPIGANDLWIAAHALALDCALVTANEGEFRRVSELRIENWLGD